MVSRTPRLKPAGMRITNSGSPDSSSAASLAPSLFSLNEKTILVTGGGGGLGSVLAVAILESGADVVCVDLQPTPGNEEWETISSKATQCGLRASYHKCDVADDGQVIELFATVAKELRFPLTGIVTCAGIQQMIPVLEYPAAQFRRVLDINVTGTFLVAQEAAKLFRSQKVSGSIVMVSSMSGNIANKGLTCTAYNTSKAAVQQMCRSMAAELGAQDDSGCSIRVNTLSPGYIRTAMTDQLLAEKPDLTTLWLEGSMLGKLAAPDEFRGPVLFLLSHASSFMTGADLRVDGGHCAW